MDDSGPGIPEEHIGLVFERFYRVEADRGGRESTGLGLSIARWAIESNGGEVTARNLENGGSVFDILLPASRPDSVFDDSSE